MERHCDCWEVVSGEGSIRTDFDIEHWKQDSNLELVCYTTKGGKGRRLARNQYGSECSYRVYWEDVPSELYVSEERIRSSFGARNPKWLKRHLKWKGCGRAVSFGRVDFYGRSVGIYEGYASFRRCEWKADITGFCKSHKPSAIIDGKVPSDGFFKRLLSRITDKTN